MNNNYDDDKNKDIFRKPEETEKRPESTLIKKEIIRLPNGQEHITKKVEFKKNESGHWEKITKVLPIPDSSGRYFYADMIAGISWSGHPIPIDHFASCKNPWEDHGYRLIYMKIDGFATEFGNVLCSECYKKNQKKDRLKKWFGWLYQTEIY